MKYLQDKIDKSVGAKYLYICVRHTANMSLDYQLKIKTIPIYDQLTGKLYNPMTSVINFFCK